MLATIAERVVGPLIGTISGYCNLPAYGKLKWAEMQRGKHSYFREQDFWRDAIGGYFYEPASQVLREGDVVELQQFELSEWFPRAPGAFWTKRGFELRNHALAEAESYLVLTPTGKQLMIQGGFGTMRLKPRITEKQKYRILGATSSGNCNCGVPLVMLEDVYEKISSDLLTEKSLCANVKGRYALVPISLDKIVLSASGAHVPQEVADQVCSSFYVPHNCVLVESVLLVKDIRPGLGLQAAAWSVYQSKERDYGWTYRTFDPRDEDSLKNAVNWLHDYAGQHGGRQFLTEFDEGTNRLNSEWPIDKIFAGAISPRSHVEEIIKWGNKLIG